MVVIYVYAPETDEIIGYSIGSRGIKTVKRPKKQLEGIEICSDDWLSFLRVFGGETHKVGKQYTKHIEGVNTLIRARNRRFVRKPPVFQKIKLTMIFLLL